MLRLSNLNTMVTRLQFHRLFGPGFVRNPKPLRSFVDDLEITLKAEGTQESALMLKSGEARQKPALLARLPHFDEATWRDDVHSSLSLAIESDISLCFQKLRGLYVGNECLRCMEVAYKA